LIDFQRIIRTKKYSGSYHFYPIGGSKIYKYKNASLNEENNFSEGWAVARQDLILLQMKVDLTVALVDL
jgi:hypothetical protein